MNSGGLDVLIFCFIFDQGMPKQERARSQTDESGRAQMDECNDVPTASPLTFLPVPEPSSLLRYLQDHSCEAEFASERIYERKERSRIRLVMTFSPENLQFQFFLGSRRFSGEGHGVRARISILALCESITIRTSPGRLPGTTTSPHDRMSELCFAITLMVV